MTERAESVKPDTPRIDTRLPGKQSDETLKQALAEGSHNAFEELLTRYETPVITFCYAFLRNREAAEDIAQETFMRVFRNAKRYQPVAKFTTRSEEHTSELQSRGLISYAV